MKVKLNFSGAAIRDFFINNGEKIVLGITIFILLLFMYGAITAKPLEDSKSADSIKRDSSQAEGRIHDVAWSKDVEKEQGIQTVKFDPKISMEKIPNIDFPNPWNPNIFPDLMKRADPQIFPVEDLQIASGYALVPYSKDNGGGPGAPPAAAPAAGNTQIPINAAVLGVSAPGADARPTFYTIITGAVPYEREIAEFKRRFDYAVKVDRPTAAAAPTMGGATAATALASPDSPNYYFFRVQRAEASGADPNLQWVDLDWHALVPDGGRPDANKWDPGPYPEIVDSAYIFPMQTTPSGALNLYTTWPLPPVFLKMWGLEASHPKVALLRPQGSADQPTGPGGDANPIPVNPLEGSGLPGLAAPAARPPVAIAPAARPAGGGFGAAPSAPAIRPNNFVANNGDSTVAVPTPPYKLFRFIDTTVEKGKTYRYRILLVLTNPNFDVKPEYLENPDSAKKRLVESPWSEQTRLVSVPQDVQVLADDVSTPRGAGGEPVAKINVLTLVKDDKTSDWVEVTKDFELPLGAFAWFKDVKIDNVPDMAASAILQKVTVPSLNANLDMLLDARGDDPLAAGKSKGPIELLFFDANGKLNVSDSAVDAATLNDYQQRTNVPKNPAPAAGGNAGDG